MCAHLSRRLKTFMYENGCNSWSRSKCLVFDAALLTAAAVIAQCSPNLPCDRSLVCVLSRYL